MWFYNASFIKQFCDGVLSCESGDAHKLWSSINGYIVCGYVCMWSVIKAFGDRVVRNKCATSETNAICPTAHGEMRHYQHKVRASVAQQKPRIIIIIW